MGQLDAAALIANAVGYLVLTMLCAFRRNRWLLLESVSSSLVVGFGAFLTLVQVWPGEPWFRLAFGVLVANVMLFISLVTSHDRR